MSQSSSPSKSKKKSYANCPPIQLIVRDNEGWRLYKQHHKTGKLQIQSPTKKCYDADIIFSSDGKYFAVLLEEGIEIYDSLSGRNITFLKHYRARNVYFSPLNTFIISYHHRRQDDKHGNCWVWKWTHSQNENETQTKNKNKQNKKENDDESKTNDKENVNSSSSNNRVIYNFFLPEFDKKRLPLSFSNDELIAARITRNAVLIHDVKRMHYRSNNIIGKLDIPNVNQVSVAPTKRNNEPSQSEKNKISFSSSSSSNKQSSSYLLAVFALPKNNKAATVTIYEYEYLLAISNKSKHQKLFNKCSQRAFYNVDQCTLLWDNNVSSYNKTLLVIASSDVDTSGQSYYGNQTLFLLQSKQNLTVKIPIANKGKLQDAQWHPYGKEFVMIDDHPQKITVFNNRGIESMSLGQYARNLIRFSKDGRFLWLGGFGNLTGEMSFYDWKNNKKCIGYANDDACRYFEWSPDSSTFLTARLYPYMTVDNGFKIYKYNGKLLHEEKFNRLYQICYRPSLKNIYPQRSPSPSSRNAVAVPKPKQKKRYVPPHLRKTKEDKKNKNKQKAQPQSQQQQPQQPQRQQPPQQQARSSQQTMNNQQPQQQQQRNYNQQRNQNQNYNYNQQQQQQNYYNNNRGQPQQQHGQYQQQNYQSMQQPQQNYHQQQNYYNQYQQPPQQQPPQHQQAQQQPQQQQAQQFNANNNNNMNNRNQNGNNNVNNNNNNDDNNNNNNNEGGGGKKKKRRKRNKNKNKNNKPGLADNDNKRWARGSKFTE